MTNSIFTMTKSVSIYSPVSPSDTYCIYDQFHFGAKNHFAAEVKGKEQAVSAYAFYKVFYPGYSLGLSTKEYYDHKINSYRQWT